jgi:hypothetical protein
MFNYVPIKHKQMSFVVNGGKFKLYTVLNGLIFPTPTQPRISFERVIVIMYTDKNCRRGRLRPCQDNFEDVNGFRDQSVPTQHFLRVVKSNGREIGFRGLF